MKRLVTLLLVAVCVAACSGESTPAITLDLSGTMDVVELSAELSFPDQLSDTGASDVLELFPTELPPADFGPACLPGDGCFMDPCDDGDHCQSGLCVEHMGDLVCTDTCVEECPEGWECRQVGGGPDGMFACLSPYSHLCRPCLDSEDCSSTTGVEDVCLVLGPEGSFCGAVCSDEGACPVGFSCVDALTVDGGAVKQCVPDSGICSCSETAVKLGLVAGCHVENEWGLCAGVRSCDSEGLSPCSAATPSEEVCNGVDDDCDGEIDEGADDGASGICDDGDECTEDSCDPEAGCLNEPLTGTSCDDEDVCTLADHCDAGECVGAPIDCDDGDLCTTDSCDPTGGCVFYTNTLPCDDGDPCTVNDECSQGDCVGFGVPCECQEDLDCVLLEDGDICNGTLFCDISQFPQQCAVDESTVIFCPEPEGLGAECLAPACHPLSGECSLVPANDGAACNDGNACTAGETCMDGACLEGDAVNCTDENPCTTDSCDPDSGCFFHANTLPCNDGNTCTTGDTCAEGDCAGTDLLGCDDGNVCTDDGCDPETGCVHEPNALPCDDGNSCTTDDKCAAGQCLGTGMLACDDNNPCTNDICLADGGCSHENHQLPCDDGNPCTAGDVCFGGECLSGAAVDCDDSNPCTDDFCADGVCIHAANDGECDDDNPCTIGDHCAGGMCAPAGALDCDDDEVCTTDWCDPAGQGCTHSNNALPCDDGNACTTGELCLGGVCQGGGDLNCNDGNLCTDDSCDPEEGCLNTDNLLPCNDGDACTTGDQCLEGACSGPGEANCNDGNGCTEDTCDPVSGCKHTFLDSPCNDGNPCTTGDVCQAGACIGAGALDCDDGNLCTDDSCSGESGCVYVDNAAPCSDDDVCTLGDQCQEGSCQSSGTLDCNDNNGCTDDWCDAVAGCQTAPNDAPCDDNNQCTSSDGCVGGVCVGGEAPDCDDDNVCTVDVCLWDSGCTQLPLAVGADAGVCLECDGGGGFQGPADDAECGEVVCSGWFQSDGLAGPAETQECHNLENFSDDRCEGEGDCKDDNTADCDGQPFAETVYECGKCRYIPEDACTAESLGECADYDPGTKSGLCRQCDGAGGEEMPADDDECGVIECGGLDYFYANGQASADGTNQCMERQYADLAAGRCLELGECKQDNGGACVEFDDVVVATCGLCTFAEGACTECATYPDNTPCGDGKQCDAGECKETTYGDGTDGNLVVSGANTVVNHYTYLTAETTAEGAQTITLADPAAFGAGDEVLIIQMQHSGQAGIFEFAQVDNKIGKDLELAQPLKNSYYSGSFDIAVATVTQVVRVPQYLDVTVAEGASIVSQEWNGHTGGIVVFRADGVVNVDGSISASGRGFRGGPQHNDNTHGRQGESITGLGVLSASANAGGGGGGQWVVWNGGDTISASGGGGGYGTDGAAGTNCQTAAGGAGGAAQGSEDLSLISLGSGGGAAGDEDRSSPGGPAGGKGGGAVVIFGKTMLVGGAINADGGNGSGNTEWDSGVSGAGSGGAIHITGEAITITGTVTAVGGTGGSTSNWCGANKGGDGSVGRIRVDYDALNGSTNPPHFEE